MKLINIEPKGNGNIKPCPFCGVVPKIEIVTLGKNQDVFLLKCTNNYCPSNKNWGIDKQELINAWNERT